MKLRNINQIIATIKGNTYAFTKSKLIWQEQTFAQRLVLLGLVLKKKKKDKQFAIFMLIYVEFLTPFVQPTATELCVAL